MYGLDRSGMFGVDANGQEYGMLGDEKVPIGLRREEMLIHNNYFMKMMGWTVPPKPPVRSPIEVAGSSS